MDGYWKPAKVHKTHKCVRGSLFCVTLYGTFEHFRSDVAGATWVHTCCLFTLAEPRYEWKPLKSAFSCTDSRALYDPYPLVLKPWTRQLFVFLDSNYATVACIIPFAFFGAPKTRSRIFPIES